MIIGGDSWGVMGSGRHSMGRMEGLGNGSGLGCGVGVGGCFEEIQS